MWKLEVLYIVMDGYFNFLDIGYEYFIVIFKYIFKKIYINMKICQKEEVYIYVNRIEGVWKYVKGYFKRMFEIKINYFEGYFVEIMWRLVVKWDVYILFFDFVKFVYFLDKFLIYKYMILYFGLFFRFLVI